MGLKNNQSNKSFLESVGRPFFKVFVKTIETVSFYLKTPKQRDKDAIFNLVNQFYKKHHQKTPFVSGKSYIKASGATYDSSEMIGMTDVALDFWLTEGKKVFSLSQKLKSFTGNQFCSLTVSGSSANLLAVSALTSKDLGERRIKPGDEVITAACGFPTTVAPIIQNQAVPVFVDIDLQTLNVLPEIFEKAITKKTKAIVIAHTLGFPFQVDKIKRLAKKHNLWLLEDSCDALGASIGGKPITSFGDISTVSFFPAHQMTTGEGGAIFTNNPRLFRSINKFRDWGRDCWCKPGDDNTCHRRFKQQFGTLPFGYDHKYIYTEVGYNMRMTEMQAAIGVSQMDKLDGFIKARNNNFNYLRQKLKGFDNKYFIPIKIYKRIKPSPFGYVFIIKDNSKIDTDKMITHFESNGVATRRIFGGNLLRQPAYRDVKHKVVGKLTVSDYSLKNIFWVGLHPGVSKAELDHIVKTTKDYISTLKE